jgi:quercetin dioxygenase-like cupin family protein
MTSSMADKQATVISEAEQNFSDVERARSTEMAILIGPMHGAPNFTKRKFRMAPGARIPKHVHPDLEHEQFVLSGTLTLSLDGEVQDVESGEAVFIPAGTVHWYENRGDEPVEFLCSIPNKAYETNWLETLDE